MTKLQHVIIVDTMLLSVGVFTAINLSINKHLYLFDSYTLSNAEKTHTLPYKQPA